MDRRFLVFNVCLVVVLLVALSPLFSHGWRLLRVGGYDLFLRPLVEETVRGMIRPELVRK